MDSLLYIIFIIGWRLSWRNGAKWIMWGGESHDSVHEVKSIFEVFGTDFLGLTSHLMNVKSPMPVTL